MKDESAAVAPRAVETSVIDRADVPGPRRPMSPAGCGRFLRRRLTAELPAIVDGFVEGAKKGGCAHMKLTTELLETGKKTGSRKDAAARKMLRELGDAAKTQKRASF